MEKYLLQLEEMEVCSHESKVTYTQIVMSSKKERLSRDSVSKKGVRS